MNVSHYNIVVNFSEISAKQLTKILIFCRYFVLKFDSDLSSHLFSGSYRGMALV